MLRAEDVKAYYETRRGPVRALDGVSIALHENEIVGIAGESGCGKSTLVKVLYDNVASPLRLVSGRAVLTRAADDTSVLAASGSIQDRWWRDISFVPQASMSVLNPVVRIGPHFRDSADAAFRQMGRGAFWARVREVLSGLRLGDDVLSAFPHQLSGGMRQRVVIALATFLDPRFILADEPTTALDVVTQKEILTLLVDVQRRMKNSLVIVSHDMAVHYQVTGRLAIMYAGKLVECGPTSGIFREPRHPYTRLLIGALPRIGQRGKLSGISGVPPSLLSPPAGCRFAGRCPNVMDRCRSEEPAVRSVGNRHVVACHLHEPVAEDDS